MITGAHFLFFSVDADADRRFLRETFGFVALDAGGGWLIFGLPPAELAIHPAEMSFVQQHGTLDLIGSVLYLMCDNIAQEIERLQAKNVICSSTEEADWGISTTVPLPSGGRIGLYEPKHSTAIEH
jgi:hypothetical protein